MVGQHKFSALEQSIPTALALLHLHYNSGWGRLHFNCTGSEVVEESLKAFSTQDQVCILRAVLIETLGMIGGLLNCEFRDLIDAVSGWGALTAEELLVKPRMIADEAGQRLGFVISCNNKHAELELCFSAEGVGKLGALDRARLRYNVECSLKGKLSLPDRVWVFAGPEYCKVTLFNKGEVVQDLLAGKGCGRVIAFGDSAVDLPFLELKPAGMLYEAYFVGDPKDVAGVPDLLLGPARGPAGLQQVLQAVLMDTGNATPVTAVVSDIDNCLAALEMVMEPGLACLLAECLRGGIKVDLITGGMYPGDYRQRIIEPIIAALRNS